MRTKLYHLSSSRRNWRDVPTLVRLDLNVPIEKAKVTDFSRIEAAVNAGTLLYLIEKGAKVAVLAHLGRFEAGKTSASTQILQQPLAELLRRKMGRPISVNYCPDVTGQRVEAEISQLAPGEILLLGNSRFSADDENNNPELARRLAVMTERFVFDAFGAAHRDQASTTGIIDLKPRGKVYLGFLMEQEVKKLNLFTGNKPKSVACIGGAKLKEKIGAIEGLLKNGWKILLGGVPLNVALKVMGYDIGDSLCTEKGKSYDEQMRALLNRYIGGFIIPPAVTIVPKGSPKTVQVLKISEKVPADHLIVDFVLSQDAESSLASAQRIIQAGPMGWFEQGHNLADSAVIHFMEGCPQALSLGGDTAAATGFFHFSTGGGSAIQFLSTGTLPVLER